MKVSDLKALIDKLPPDAPVVMPGHDHTYHDVFAVAVAQAQVPPKPNLLRPYEEYHGPDSLKAGYSVINVLVIKWWQAE